jgi:translation initiation factor IF-2
VGDPSEFVEMPLTQFRLMYGTAVRPAELTETFEKDLMAKEGAEGAPAASTATPPAPARDRPGERGSRERGPRPGGPRPQGQRPPEGQHPPEGQQSGTPQSEGGEQRRRRRRGGKRRRRGRGGGGGGGEGGGGGTPS